MRKLTLVLAFFLIPSIAFVQDDKDQDKDQEKEKELQEMAKKHKATVTEMRGLEFKKEVKVGIYTKEELRKFMDKELKKDLPPEKVAKYQKTYVHFGLIPEDLDLYEAILDLYEGGVAGFYHPETKELYLIGEGEESAEDKMMKQMFGVTSAEMTMVHELVHAAQDQNHELSTLPMDTENNDDMLMAMKGVIEGDASVVGFRFAFQDQFDTIMGMQLGAYKRGALPGKAANLPRYMRQTLTFPYGYGTEFVMKYCDEDMKKAEELFKKLPTSSEQILHPEKYTGENPDWPTIITFDDILKTIESKGEILEENVHGEFALRILLKEIGAGSSRKSRQAAEGWDGDRYFVIEEDKKVFSVWYTTWDDIDEAKEFAERYRDGINSKYEKKEILLKKDDEDKRVWHLGDRRVIVERRGEDVLILDNVTTDVATKTDAIFEAARKKELTKITRKIPGKFYCPTHPAHTKDKAGKCRYCDKDLKSRDTPSEDKDKKKDYR